MKMKDESRTAEIMDWLEGRMDQEAESDFLARQASDAELAEECRQLEELLGALADLDEDLIPPASFHESVMRGVRAEAAGSEEAGPATLVAGVRGLLTADAQRLNRPNAAAKAPFPGPDGGEGPGKEKRLTLFQRLRLGTVLPVAACLLALVIAMPRLFGAGAGNSAAQTSAGGGASMNMSMDLGALPMEEFYGEAESGDIASDYDGLAGAGPQLNSRSAPGAADMEKAKTAADEENQTEEAVSRKIIRDGQMSLRVDSFDRALEELSAAVAERGGYVVNQNRYSQDGKSQTSGSVTVKVPYDRFEELVALARELGKATDERVDTQDVTDQYIDLTTRIQVYETKLDRLLELLEQSGDLSEVLAVENELANTRAEFESLRGQLRYLTNQTSYSTLRINLTEKPAEASEIQVEGFAGFWRELKESFVMGINSVISGLGGFFVALAGWLPALIGLGAAALILWKAWLKKWWRSQKR